MEMLLSFRSTCFPEISGTRVGVGEGIQKGMEGSGCISWSSQEGLPEAGPLPTPSPDSGSCWHHRFNSLGTCDSDAD